MKIGWIIIFLIILFSSVSCSGARLGAPEKRGPSLSSTQKYEARELSEKAEIPPEEARDERKKAPSDASAGAPEKGIVEYNAMQPPVPSEPVPSGEKEAEDLSSLESQLARPQTQLDNFELQESIEQPEEKYEMKELEAAPQAEKAGGVSPEPRKFEDKVKGKREEEELFKREISEGKDEKDAAKAMLQDFRVRSRFPEILYFNPSLVTEKDGSAVIYIPSMDSISSFDINVSAATSNGEWGSGKDSFKTFKNFFIDFDPPKKLHIGDNVKLSAALFNYTKKTLDFEVIIFAHRGIELKGDWKRKVSIQPSKVVELKFNVKAAKLGAGSIGINAIAADKKLSDSITRTIEVYPSEPEARLNLGGTLSKGKNKIEIPIPEKAIILNDWADESRMYISVPTPYIRPQVWLRIYDDPTFGSFELTQEISEIPHASLIRSIAYVESCILTRSRLKALSLDTKPLYEYLQKSVESGWGRILAFRSKDGFSLYPGEKSDTFADLMVLETMKKMEKTIPIDQDLLKVLEDKALAYMLNERNKLTDRLYAAYLIADSKNVLNTSKAKIVSLVNSIPPSERDDLLIRALALRIASSSGLEDIKTSLSANLLTLIDYANKTGYSSKSIVGTWRGGAYPFALSLIAESQPDDILKQDSELKSKLQNSLIKIAYNDTSNVMKKVDAITAIQLLGWEHTSDTILKSISLNGVSLEKDRYYGFYLNPLTPFKNTDYPLEIPLNLKPGMNKLVIETIMLNVSYQVVGKYYYQDEKRTKPADIDFKIPEKVSDEGIFHAELNISTPKDFAGEGSIIHIPLPPGVKPIDSPRALARRIAADYAEVRENEIILYFKNLKPHISNRFILPMSTSIHGEFYIPPPSIESDLTGTVYQTGKSQKVKWI